MFTLSRHVRCNRRAGLGGRKPPLLAEVDHFPQRSAVLPSDPAAHLLKHKDLSRADRCAFGKAVATLRAADLVLMHRKGWSRGAYERHSCG